MRLFIGFFPSREAVEAIHDRSLRFENPEALRWIDGEALHVTLEFLGEVDDSKTHDIQSLMVNLSSRYPLATVRCAGAGVFPKTSHPSVFWTGIHGETAPLIELQATLRRRFIDAGFNIETRDFHLHLTVARTRKGTMELSKQFCTLFGDFQSPMFTVNAVHLIESRLGPNGSRYRSIFSAALGLR